ncbi:MAG: hypothetical protein QOD83_2507 [Solirubrobacteraceae bacterium]|jgi:hypothetical protein|nr:hypothetical protein [Solirubrobacteraceae bacterium]
MPECPRFPSSALTSWLELFSAAIALITVWVLPIGLTSQVVASALFALVPLVLLVFWLGQTAERRVHDKDMIRPPSQD